VSVHSKTSRASSLDDEALAYIAADAVVVVDREGKIVSLSEAAERITGYAQAEATGVPCSEVFDTSLSDAIARTSQDGSLQSNLDAQVRAADGETASVCASISPLKDIGGHLVGAVVTFRSVDEMARLLGRLSQRTDEVLMERDKLNAILNSIAEGVFTVDEAWRITSFSRGAEQITGYTAQEAVGMACCDLFRSDLCETSCPLKHSLGEEKATYDIEAEIITKAGKSIPIRVNAAPLYDAEGNRIGGVETFRDLSKERELTQALEGRYSFHNIIGKSKSMQELFALLEDVVETDATVLIQGASGTGKELVARALHHNGPRRERPFVAINCAALPEQLLESELFGYEKGAFTGAIQQKPGRFERADGGTLFLDEIGEMSPALQAKVLRVLDQNEFERVGGTEAIPVDVRVIAATNQDIQTAIQSGSFRQDLYYRLNVVPVRLPDLAERLEDIPLLVDHFVQTFNAQTSRSIRRLSRSAMALLMRHTWPGNVRELENAIEHAFVRCGGDVIMSDDLPGTLRADQPTEGIAQAEDPLRAGERSVLEATLNSVNGNKRKAAQLLGISRTTLWRKMKRHRLS